MKKHLWLIASILILLSGLAQAEIALPQRIVSGIPAVTEILFGLGLEDRIVGISSLDNYPESVKNKEKVGTLTLNLEKIISLNPDLVILFGDAQKAEIPKLRRLHVPTMTVDANSIEEIYQIIIHIGQMTGSEINAANLIGIMKKNLDEVHYYVKDRPVKPVFIMVGYKPMVGVGKGSYINNVISLARGKNLTEYSKNPYPLLSFEQFMKMDPPAVIIPEGLVSLEEIQHDPRWREISAVKNGKILMINADIISRPGPRIVQAVEEIARFLHE